VLEQKMFREEKKNFKKSAKLSKASTGSHSQETAITAAGAAIPDPMVQEQHLKQEIASLKEVIQKYQQQQQQQENEKRLVKATSNKSDSDVVNSLKDQLSTAQQDLQTTQRSLASLFKERDDYKRENENIQQELEIVRRQQQQQDSCLENENVQRTSSGTIESACCTTCEGYKLRLLSLEEELDGTHKALAHTKIQHSDQRLKWQEEINTANVAVATANAKQHKDFNLKQLLEKYREEIETLREENRILQRSSFYSVNTSDDHNIYNNNDEDNNNNNNNNKVQDQPSATIAAAIAVKEGELLASRQEWEKERKKLEEQLNRQQKEWIREKQDLQKQIQRLELREVELTQSQLQRTREDQSLVQQLSQFQLASLREKEVLEKQLRDARSRENEFHRMQKEWDQERQGLENKLSNQLVDWQKVKKTLESQLQELYEQKEDQDTQCNLKEELLQQQKQWQQEKELLESKLQLQDKQMEDWKLLVPRNKVLLEQSQAKNESLKTQLAEVRSQVHEYTVTNRTLQCEKEVLEQELEQHRNGHGARHFGNAEHVVASEPVLLPSEVSPEDLMELNMTKKHVIEWEWTNPNGLGGMYTGWLDLEGNPDGHGTLRVEDGSVFIGHWQRGRKNGNGVYSSIDGAVYSGPWVDDKFQGRGVYVSDENQVYTGDWLKGCRHGKGIESWEHGAVYVGNYRNDKRNGTPTCHYLLDCNGAFCRKLTFHLSLINIRHG
jgi:hypothetical protein